MQAYNPLQRIDRDNNIVYHVLKLCRSFFYGSGTRCH
jgi:hypothetical protein